MLAGVDVQPQSNRTREFRAAKGAAARGAGAFWGLQLDLAHIPPSFHLFLFLLRGTSNSDLWLRKQSSQLDSGQLGGGIFGPFHDTILLGPLSLCTVMVTAAWCHPRAGATLLYAFAENIHFLNAVWSRFASGASRRGLRAAGVSPAPPSPAKPLAQGSAFIAGG